jgi:HNH endonuclease
MKKESILDYKYLLTILEYDKEEGYFYWLEEKKGRDLTRPAGTRTAAGYGTINIDGIIYSMSRLAWFYMNGSWPSQEIGYKDGNPNNCSWDNLIPISNKERLSNFKLKQESLNTPNINNSTGNYRARFSNKEVADAVEEFIKDKVLVGGRYIRKE